MTITYGPRVRVTGPTTLFNNHQLIYKRTTAGVLSISTNTWNQSYYEKLTMNDVVVENFKQRMGSGEIFNNPMSHVYEVEDRTLCEGQINCTGWVYFGAWDKVANCLTAYGYLPLTSSQLTSITDTKAYVTTKALAKVTSAQEQAIVILGELKETKNMFKNTLGFLMGFTGKVENAVDKFRKLRLRQLGGASPKIVAKALKLAMDSWMEVRFGWRPFYYQALSLYDTINAQKTAPPKRQTFRSGTTQNLKRTERKVHVYGGITETFDREISFEGSIKAGVLCEQRYGGIPDTWGLTKIPQAIWELTSLSWAVDYFFNIGDAIASYTPDSLWSKKVAWVTTRSVERASIKFVGYNQPPNTSTWTKMGEYIKVTTTKKRETCDTYGTVIFRPRMNWAKYIDLAGVVHSRLQSQIGRLAHFAGDHISKKKRR